MDTVAQRKRQKIYLKIVRETGTTYVGTIAGLIIGYANVVLITRFVTPAHYGIYSLGLTITGLVMMIGTLSLNDALVRFIPWYHAQGRQDSIRDLIKVCLFGSLSASIVLVGLMFACAGSLAHHVFHKEELEGVLRLFSLSVPLLMVSFQVGHVFMGYKDMRYAVYLNRIALPLGQLVVLVIFFGLGFRLYGLVGAYCISTFCTALLAIYYLWRHLVPMLPAGSRPCDRREIVSYAYPLLGNRLLVFLLNGCIDILLLGYFLGSADVGVYKVAQLTVQPLALVMFSFALIGKPVLAELVARGQWDEVKEIYRRITKWILCLNVPLFVIFAAFGRHVLTVFFTEKFTGGESALQLLALGFLVNALCGPEGKALDAAGRTRILFFNAACAFVLNVILGCLLIPRLGLSGVAVAVSGALVLQGLLGMGQLLYYHHVHPLSSRLARTLGAGALLYGGMWHVAGFFSTHLAALAAAVLVVFVAWGILLVLFRVLDRTDKEILDRLRQKLKDKAKDVSEIVFG